MIQSWLRSSDPLPAAIPANCNSSEVQPGLFHSHGLQQLQQQPACPAQQARVCQQAQRERQLPKAGHTRHAWGAMGFMTGKGCGVQVPPSLQNMFKELKTDCGCSVPSHGDLQKVGSAVTRIQHPLPQDMNCNFAHIPLARSTCSLQGPPGQWAGSTSTNLQTHVLLPETGLLV